MILAVFLLLGQPVAGSTAVKCLFPTTFGQNWYVTCYLLFYLAHPYINRAIHTMSQRELLGVSAALIVLYNIVPMLYPGLFFSSSLLTFLTIYCSVAYIKKYMKRFADNVRMNLLVFLASTALMLLILLGLNTLGVKGIFVTEDMFRFCGWGDCILNLLISISLLNIFRNLHFTSIPINRLSALSLLIYIIHENFLVRQYLRPSIWVWLHDTFGYDHLLLLVLGFAAALLVISGVLGAVYQHTLGKLVDKVSGKILTVFQAVCYRAADILMRF